VELEHVNPRVSTQTILDVRDVRVRYGGVEAVTGASLSIQSPQIVGLIGPNGAGKSSLLAAIGGQIGCTSGRVCVLGANVTHLAPHRRARLGIVRTFQSASVFDGLTVFENLLVAGMGHTGSGLRHALISGPQAKAAALSARSSAERMLDDFELWAMADSYGRELSGGQRRLVEIARCLMRSPKLLLLDEPMVGVAPHLVKRIGDACKAIRDRGVAIIIVEHALEVVEAVCDRVIVMAAGDVIDDGRYEDVLTSGSVKEAYFV
jgi:ABC-type branched-subunit amino acid transport system ATPase component